jgi:hypothetical protein
MSEDMFTDIIPLTPLFSPSRIFAPFVNASEISLIDFSNRTEGPFNFILGFVTADSENNTVWSEGTPLYSQELESSISSIRMLGGDAVLSFGGPNSSSKIMRQSFNQIKAPPWQVFLVRQKSWWMFTGQQSTSFQ